MNDRAGILFPIMLIAAIAVIALSGIGIVTMLGWMPEPLSSSQPVSRAAAAQVGPKAVREAVTPCIDCASAEPVRKEPAQNAGSPRLAPQSRLPGADDPRS